MHERVAVGAGARLPAEFPYECRRSVPVHNTRSSARLRHNGLMVCFELYAWLTRVVKRVVSNNARPCANMFRHVIERVLNPLNLSDMASYDVASNICRPYW